MKKSTLHFGEFKQYDKKFITAENGINPESVCDVAFEGEVLYLTNGESLFQYDNGNVKKLTGRDSRLFSKKGKLYGAVGNSLAEIKKGKI